MKTVFLRVLQADNKAAALLRAIREPERARGRERFEVSPTSFASVPRSPFAYWVSEKLLRLFAYEDPLHNERRLVVSTNPLNDDFRYVRLWWETAPGSFRRIWMPWAKGGSYSPFYYDIDTTIGWDGSRLTYAGFLGTDNRPLERPASVQHFFRPGLTWPRRTQGGFSFRAMPAGCIFADKGPALFVENNAIGELLALLGVANSRVFKAMIDMQMAFGSYEVGVLQRTPAPRLTEPSCSELGRLAYRAWSLKRILDTCTENSHAFALPALLQVAGADIASRIAAWSEHIQKIEAALVTIQAEIDERCFDLYGIDEVDRRAITEGFGPRVSGELSNDSKSDDDDAGADATENEPAADPERLAADLLSWAIGVAFGRFDVRLTTGSCPVAAEAEPFEPLLACSAGMLTGGDGLPLARPPAEYPLGFPETGILIDDPGHAQDLVSAIRAVFRMVFGGDPDRWYDDVTSVIDPKRQDLRGWLADSFFGFHLKRYSKSRRKAPVYWQLATTSASFSVWLYGQRLTRDSFFQLRKDVVEPKLAHEERTFTRLAQDARGNPTAQQRKAISAQETFIEELRVFHDEIARVAPLWNPNLDDGIVITCAPLWRLFPQHKQWQQELKSCWDDLCAGKYDWSHLAMHLWPERIVPLCAKDRSIAIAHGLERFFWVEEPAGKWKAKNVSRDEVEKIVRERSSAAVKQALNDLMNAPAPGGSRRSRRVSARGVETLGSTA